MTILIDRSNNNPADDLAAAKKAGVSHLYAKASEGTGFTDATWHTRRDAAHAAGLVFGSYHFAGTGNPTAEADHFLGIIGTPKPGTLRPCLDLESGQSAAWAAEFAAHIKAKLGYLPALYGNTSTIPSLRAANATVKACPWWAADYGPNDGQLHPLPAGTPAAAHQYTSVAHITGVSGPTDASVFHDEAAMLVPGAPKPPRPRWSVVVDGKTVAHTNHPKLWEAGHPLRYRKHDSIWFHKPKT